MLSEYHWEPPLVALRQPHRVCEAHLHQACKPCVIGVIPSQTYEDHNYINYYLQFDN